MTRAREATARLLERHGALIASRETNGFTRRCHGDLHLGNLVQLHGDIVAFDCLEFSPALATTDVFADVAFLFMDLSFHQHNDLAYAFIDGYLERTGDYEGACLLNLFAVYRADVRAKVAALRYRQTDAQHDLNEVSGHLAWAHGRVARRPGRVLLTYGFSGSGKSFWSRQLVPAIGAVRIRSDILRKVHAGLSSHARTGSAVSGGLYTADRSTQTYRSMARLARRLAQEGETVIVDAACLQHSQRQAVYDECDAHDITCRLLRFDAPRDILEKRIVKRSQAGNDPSEADLEVLAWQYEHAEPPSSEEPNLDFDTERGTLEDLLALIR